jgi:hypothetical protein
VIDRLVLLVQSQPWEINASRESIFFSWIVILFGNCGVAAMVIFQGYIISKGARVSLLVLIN